MLNFVYLRSSRLKVLHFWLDSCIVNKGEKFELVLGYFMHLEGFQVVSSHFWLVGVTGLTGQSAGPVHMLSTGLTGGGDRFDRSELSWCNCSVFFKWLACIRPGGALSGFGVFIGGLHSLLEHCFVSNVSSHCPFLRGPRLVFFK
jgi:hypothetical protein